MICFSFDTSGLPAGGTTPHRGLSVINKFAFNCRRRNAYRILLSDLTWSGKGVGRGPGFLVSSLGCGQALEIRLSCSRHQRTVRAACSA